MIQKCPWRLMVLNSMLFKNFNSNVFNAEKR